MLLIKHCWHEKALYPLRLAAWRRNLSISSHAHLRFLVCNSMGNCCHGNYSINVSQKIPKLLHYETSNWLGCIISHFLTMQILWTFIRPYSKAQQLTKIKSILKRTQAKKDINKLSNEFRWIFRIKKGHCVL